MESISAWDSGIRGPATAPCTTRAAISSGMLGASPHMIEATVNSIVASKNSRTWPRRSASRPVSGMEIAVATVKEVMTQVPCVALMPMVPAIVGTDTLAMVVSSTCMKVASDTPKVAIASCAPCSGASGCAALIRPAARPRACSRG